VPQPRFAAVRSLSERRRAADEVGFPAVLKPADSGGQRGVFRVESVDDIERHLHEALAASPSGEAILEEFIEGMEMNGIVLARAGEAIPLTLSDRRRPPGVGFGVGWIHVYPATVYGHQLEESERVATRTVRALGLQTGIAFPQLIAHPDERITVTAADQTEDGSFTAAGSVLTIDEALERAIVISDNAAALALIRRLGIPAIHATLEREGIALRFTADGAMTTAAGIATFFGELVRGSLVSRAASSRMLARLSRQRVADRFPAALPGAVIAHKTGNLGFATHDAGIVRGPGGTPIVLVVLTWDSGEEEAIDLIREVAVLIYGGLSPVAR